jgi:hypothetical protein
LQAVKETVFSVSSLTLVKIVNLNIVVLEGDTKITAEIWSLLGLEMLLRMGLRLLLLLLELILFKFLLVLFHLVQLVLLSL